MIYAFYKFYKVAIPYYLIVFSLLYFLISLATNH